MDNKKLTSYNIFIKDSFNTIYNRKCLKILPIYIENTISKYKNKKACIVIIELAKLWVDPKYSEIIYKYKLYNNQILFFTNDTYNSIVLYIFKEEKEKILKKTKIFNFLWNPFISVKNNILNFK